MLVARVIARWATTRTKLSAVQTKLLSSSPGFESAPEVKPHHSTPNDGNNIIIKDSCLARLKKILNKPEDEFLRIHVETGGCSGFSYLFEIENKNLLDEQDDLVFERDGYRVVVNRDSLPYMRGASIDYTESLIKSSFLVINPIADTKCSCGASFSLDLNKFSQSPGEQAEEKLKSNGSEPR